MPPVSRLCRQIAEAVAYEKPTEHHFAAEGGSVAESRAGQDPFAALDDLMAVIEALCPTWPERSTFTDAGRYLL